VLHYTQIIWLDTESVGCGEAEGGGFIYVACGYGPGGNRPGEWVGARVGEPAAAPSPSPYLVFFDWDRDDITPQAAAILDNAAAEYLQSGHANVQLAANSTDEGTRGLGERRSDNVRAYLSGRGVPDAALSSGAVSVTTGGSTGTAAARQAAQDEGDDDLAEAPPPQWYLDLSEYQGRFNLAERAFRTAQQANDPAAMKTQLDSMVSIANAYGPLWNSAVNEGGMVADFSKPADMKNTITQFTDALGNMPSNIDTPQLPNDELHKPKPSSEPLDVL